MMRRAVALLVVALLVVPVVGGSVALAQENTTATPDPTPAETETPTPTPTPEAEQTGSNGDYSLSELQRGGTIHDERFPSLRVLSEMQALWLVRYKAGALDSYGDKASQEFIAPGDTVERDRVRMFGSHPFDGETREYELKIVYWTPDERRVQTEEGTRTERFANISAVQTQTVEFDAGMQQPADINLRTTDQPVHVTMWLTSNPDVRWTFRHQSVPTAQPLDISSEGEFWSEVFMRFGWIVVLGVPTAGYSARRILNKTIVGPQKGLAWWLIMLGLAGFGIAIGLWWQATTLITRIPALAGVLVCAIAFVVFLEGFDADIKQAVFERSILDEARSPGGGEVRDERYREMTSKRVIETDDGHLAIISKGWKPFFARWFADPAKIPIEDVKTQVKVEGPWEQAFVADPESDRVIEHTPPRLTWDPTLIEDVDPERDEPRSLTDRVNWKFVGVVVFGPAIGYMAGQNALGLPWTGLVLGLLPALILGTKARSGHAEFTPAPIHHTQAKATLAWEQQHYADADLNEDLREIAWLERLKNPLEGKVLRSEFEETITSRLNQLELGEEGGSIDEILEDVEGELEPDDGTNADANGRHRLEVSHDGDD